MTAQATTHPPSERRPHSPDDGAAGHGQHGGGPRPRQGREEGGGGGGGGDARGEEDEEEEQAEKEEEAIEGHSSSIGQGKPQAQSQSQSQLAGPLDLTAAKVHPDRAPLSTHVQWIRSHDWASTRLGSMATWDTELRRMVNMCMSDSKATALWWGPQRVCIYNEAYIPVLASKHPAALGHDIFDVWPEIKDAPFARAFDLANRTGEPSFGRRSPFYVDRADYIEELWASWDMIPIPGPDGILGMYNSVIEVTQEVLYERRMTLLQDLEQSISTSQSSANFWPNVLASLESAPFEAPFAALYGPPDRSPLRLVTQDFAESEDSSGSSMSERISASGEVEWALRGTTAPSTTSTNESTSLPASVTFKTTSPLTPAFRACMKSRQTSVLRASDGSLSKSLQDAMPSRIFEGQPLTHAILLPIIASAHDDRSGCLLIGLNCRRSYDSAYQRFVRLLHTQLTTGLSSLLMAEDEARRDRAAARAAARDRVNLVTQLAKTKNEAEQSEARFRSMADLAPIGIFEIDANGELQYANDHWISMTKSSLDTSNSFATFTEALVEDDREHAWAQWAKLRAGEQVRFECRLNALFVTDRVYNGERMGGDTWILVTAYALCEETSVTGGEEIRGVFGCVVDISRQKWVEGFQERQVRQYENFIDSTNHEARNPLAAITLCADDIFTTVDDLLHQSDDSQVAVDRKELLSVLESAGIIVVCAKHQKRIIDDVLTMSKLDSDMFTLSPEPTRPISAVSQAMDMFRNETRRNDVELELHLGEGFQFHRVDWLLLDPTRLLQVLANLLNNALKFTKKEASRQITVTFDVHLSRPADVDFGVRFTPDLVPQQGVAIKDSHVDWVYLSVAIQDTGLGMSDEERDHLFQKFQQASHKTYAKYGGSGLGLWICKELCCRMGGQIGVASTLASTTTQTEPAAQRASGSTFVFYVRAERCEAPTVQAQPHRPIRPQNGSAMIVQPSGGNDRATGDVEQTPDLQNTSRPQQESSSTPGTVITRADTLVLIVEDNLVNQKVIQRQIAAAGFRTSVANHGKEALNILYPPEAQSAQRSSTAKDDVDVVLMDFEMPIMGGLECTQLIRQREKEQQIPGTARRSRRPILGVTANARSEQQSAGLDAGMDLVITKPFRIDELVSAIDSVRREEG